MRDGIDDYFAGDWLKAEDVIKDVTVTIEAVSEVEIEEETKPTLTFKDFTGTLVLNKTNATEIAEIIGSTKFADWPGKKITLFRDLVPFKGKKVPAIRVKRPGK